MGKFFSKFKTAAPDAAVSSWSNLSQFYSLLIFLIAVPFVLIVALVWLTGVLGFTTWILAGFVGLCAWIGYRLHRRWGDLKAKMAAQGSEFQDMMRDAARNGKNMEISLLNGLFTVRYHGSQGLPAALPARPQPLALEGPVVMEATDTHHAAAWLPPERLREELEEFVRLRDTGIISPEEFDRIKAGLLQRLSA
ncbi:MAG: SHOCT domain-containing protein [Deltaproteobacteria bacterium]|nr:SHOCT domain-containing protein [Deltaproteobacteria bacterium]MBM4293600.1 SHOCT domain-containing protein [Deltaproteobacteria bacterium]